MDFAIKCACGERIKVIASQAGSELKCICGKIQTVPSLSELRRSAGQTAFDVSVTEKLQQLYFDGKLPLELNCVRCGSATRETLNFKVECQRPMVRGNGYWKTFFLMLFAPWIAMKQIHDDYRNPEVIGRELIIRTPIRMCSQCASQIDTVGKETKELLRRTSLYQELLTEYPQARIFL